MEGFELQVIQGALRLIKRDKPDILFEYNGNAASMMDWTAWDVAKIIQQEGDYKFYIVPMYTDAAYSSASLPELFKTKEITDPVNIFATTHDF